MARELVSTRRCSPRRSSAQSRRRRESAPRGERTLPPPLRPGNARTRECVCVNFLHSLCIATRHHRLNASEYQRRSPSDGSAHTQHSRHASRASRETPHSHTHLAIAARHSTGAKQRQTYIGPSFLSGPDRKDRIGWEGKQKLPSIGW